MAVMNISGEAIKEARERRRITQQELADELGVSLRTVGAWERGESVPRSRMGAIREALGFERPDDNRMELSRLINEELDESGRGPAAVVKDWPQGQQRSFYDWRDGAKIPRRASRNVLEDALGWRRGVVSEILDAPITREFTLSEVRDWAKLPDPSLAKARHLSNLELGSEIIVRLDTLDELRDENVRLRAELDLLRGSNVVPIHAEQSHFGLAASDDHVAGEDDRD